MISKWIALGMICCLLLTPPAFAFPSALKQKEIEIKGYGYVFSAPSIWREDHSFTEDSIKVHLKDPEGRVKGHLTVHVMARNGRGLDPWVDYHLKNNFPLVHGECVIQSKQSIAAGSFDGKMIHATDLERHKKYDLCETILMTNSHILTFSYLHGHNPKELAKRMGGIIDSFHTRSETNYCGAPYYEEGRAVGIESLGLFLRLPLGWMPKTTGQEISIELPRGEMKVFVFPRASQGIKGLKKLAEKHIPGLGDTEKMRTTNFGKNKDEAFHLRIPSKDKGQDQECYLGLQGRGGYAVWFESQSVKSHETFRRVAAEAILLDASKVKSRFKTESRKLKKVLSREDRSKLCPPLTLLSLFSESESAAKTISVGLKSKDPVIQSECARALGRMGCEQARLALKEAEEAPGASKGLKEACARALRVMNGETSN